MSKPVYLGRSTCLFGIMMQNQNMVKIQDCVIWIQTYIVKTDDNYKDIAEDVETKL